MIIHSIQDLSDSYVIGLLKDSFSKITDQKFIKNYHPDYGDVPGNFFLILEQGRYKKGCYYVIEEDGKYVGSAGWNEYDTNTALLMTRMYVDPGYRLQYYLGNNLLPLMIEHSIDYDNMWMTVNEYNKSLYKWFERVENKRRTALFDDWPNIYKNFRPIGKKIIYHTEQYVVEYKK